MLDIASHWEFTISLVAIDRAKKTQQYFDVLGAQEFIVPPAHQPPSPFLKCEHHEQIQSCHAARPRLHISYQFALRHPSQEITAD